MIPDWISWIDVSYILIVLMFAVGGAQRGFAAQLAHIMTFIAAAGLLFFAYPTIFSYFTQVFRQLEETYLMWMILITMIVLAIALFILFSKMLASLFKLQISKRGDRIWGLVLGVFRGSLTVLVIMIVLVMIDRTGRSYEIMRMKSKVGQLVCYHIAPKVQPHLTTFYDDKIGEWKAELMQREEAGELEEM